MTIHLDANGELQGVIVSGGHRMSLIAIAVAKMALQSKMPPDMRLQFLQIIETQIDAYITPAMVALIEPLCAEAMQIVDASGALKTKATNPPDFSGWRILESEHVFGLLLKLCPSIFAAIAHREASMQMHVAVRPPAVSHEPTTVLEEQQLGPASIWPRPDGRDSAPSVDNSNIDIFTGA